ncbi:MAG TPA: hypothetical protein VET88_05225 [Gammaproteobacteria bacterium]|nr:hypothetical protein [Gammaproteobacteria bacterium]
MAEKHPFWSTMPGMLAGIAAIITAVGGLLLAFYQTGILDNKGKDKGGNTGQSVVEENSGPQETHALIGQMEEKEPNENFSEATPISVDTKVNAYLIKGNDIDIFTFQTGQGYRNVFEVTLSNQGSFAPDITIFDTTKNRIDNRFSITPGADIIIPLSAQPSTKYYVKVKDLDGFKGRLGDYQLSVKS